jgi:putative Holliday junction resolvase
MRTLAVDLGSRRIGLAISDESARLATPLEVLEVNSREESLRLVADRARRHDAQRLVVGLPLNMDDTIGPAATQTAKWARELSTLTGLPLVLVDERLSSFTAEQSLNDQKRQGQKMTRKKKKQRLDAVAAADFLQGFLDGRLSEIVIDAKMK